MTPEKLAALADCPFCGGEADAVKHAPYHPRFVTTWRPGCTSCGVHLDEFDSEASAIAAWNTRALPQGYAAGVEAAAWMDDLANAIGGLLSRSNNLSGPEANTFTHPNVLALIRRYAALSSADAVMEGWRVTLSDAQRMVLGEAAWDDVQQADLFKTHATEDEKWRRIGLKIEIAINRLLELGA